MAFLIGGANSAADTGYTVANSCRFDSASSDTLTQTQSTATSDTIGTFSVWMKASSTAATRAVFSGQEDSNNRIALYFSDTLRIYGAVGGSQTVYLITNQFFRDFSAWYHVVIAWDTTQGTAANRMKVYVNGSQITSWSTETYPTEDSDIYWNKGSNLDIGARRISSVQDYYDGYLAETVFVDGQQLAPTSFGEFDEDSPTIWKPIDVSGLTFGNNGFYLDFEDSGDLGDDESGNTNDFTETNIAAIDQATDTPTNNFCTLNPLVGNLDSSLAYSDGNLKVVTSVAGNAPSTFGVSSGKWYWEQKVTSSNGYVAICNDDGYNTAASVSGSGSGSVGYFGSGEIFDEAGSAIGSLTTFTTNDIMGVHLNMDDGTIVWYKNGTEVSGSTYTFGTTGNGTLFGTAYPCWNGGGTAARSAEFNFGGCSVSAISSGNADANGYGNFEYAVPSGFYALNSKNLAEYG